jgi:hypothetical protein
MTNREIFSLKNANLFKLILCRGKEIVSTELDGETVILDFSFGMYSGLDAIGTFIWQQLENPSTIPALCEAILGRYDVVEERCISDLLEFLGDLADSGLIIIDGRNVE